MKFSTPNRKNFIRYFKIFSYFQMSVFCFFKFFNRRSLSHTIHGIFLHMKLRPVLRFFLILDKNAPVFYRWKICPHIRFFPAKFFFFFYQTYLFPFISILFYMHTKKTCKSSLKDLQVFKLIFIIRTV